MYIVMMILDLSIVFVNKTEWNEAIFFSFTHPSFDTSAKLSACKLWMTGKKKAKELKVCEK